MNKLRRAELAPSILHIERFSKLEIPMYNSDVLGMTGRNTRRRAQEIAN